MTARQEYEALVAKMDERPADPMRALTPAERVRYGTLRDRFGNSTKASPMLTAKLFVR